MSHRNPTPPRSLSAVALGAWVLASALALPSVGLAQVSPEESARKLKAADGLEATLWAAEPMVVNPTTMDVDSRGRVWITEGLNYRLTRGGNKRFQKVDEADRIKILEDTDGDGKADKMTVFADRIFPVPMGIAVEERYSKEGKYLGCKVYVGNSPNLLVLEDTDGDDKADRRYPLLTGFGGIDSDHGVHGMVLGLDGKLYFTHGDGCCSVQQDHSERSQNFDVVDRSGRHVSSDQLANTLRVNRDGTQFEILADRQRNNYETSLNSFGNIFTSDNDDDGNRGSRVIWVMDGGKYGYRTPGSPRHWGEDVPGNVPKLVGTGNGSPCGITVYEGDLLGKEYKGAIFEAEAGPRQINFFPVTRQGAAFRTEHKVLLSSDDPWFRPVDMTAAPDGSLFVADWYDAGVGGHAFSDQTTGRIYRVAPKGNKSKAVKADFSGVRGLIEALKSPVVATQFAAREGLIARGQESKLEVSKLFNDKDPILRARALWVWHAIEGDPVAVFALKDDDARIREQAVRILGRDVSLNGHVESREPIVAPNAANLGKLTPFAADADAGVRRELILSFRNAPTAQVGGALKTLARLWDGQDRWYLEALGLALDKREPAYLAELFDGNLYGDLKLDADGQSNRVALPPYFPVDRNEAFIATGEQELPASPLSKTLGLAWRVHRVEVLPLLSRIMPSLGSPELQQAGDDVIRQIGDPAGAVVLADLAGKSKDPIRRRQMLATLARKLEGSWKDAKGNARIVATIEAALKDPETSVEGVTMAAATGDGRYGPALLAFVEGPEASKASDEVRVAAVEAIGRIKPAGAREVMDRLIGEAKKQGSASPAAEAAIRALENLGDAGKAVELITAADYPLGLRREALRLALRQGDGGFRVVNLAKEGKLPADLKTEAATALSTHADQRVRQAARDVLPLPKSSAGKPLPQLYDLVRRDGKADHGREVFFKAGATSCAACHRVQGRGQWIGPDLSTIGAKYGKPELLKSILNPSAAIGYNYRSMVVALNDGRVITGLPVEQTADRLVVKTAEGQRVNVRAADVEARKTSDVSLMPEGLTESMDEQDLVDLLTFLSTLKQPVSIVGQYQAVGPLAEKEGHPAFDVKAKVDLAAPLKGADGDKLAWRRLSANAEGMVDLGTLAGNDSSRAVYLYAPVVSPSEQEARLVLDTKADVKVWLAGKELELPARSEDQPRSVALNLPKGTTDLLIRMPGGGGATIVTTFASAKPLEFSLSETSKVSNR